MENPLPGGFVPTVTRADFAGHTQMILGIERRQQQLIEELDQIRACMERLVTTLEIDAELGDATDAILNRRIDDLARRLEESRGI